MLEREPANEMTVVIEEQREKLLLSSGFNRLKRARYGVMLYNRNDTYVGRSFDQYGEYSEEEAELFRQVIRPGNIVLDIGANIGSHTLVFSKLVGHTGAVLAFEPQSIIFQTLCANMALNCVLNVRPYHAAVGEEPSHIDIPMINYNAEGNFGGLSLSEFEHREGVQLVTVDGLNLTRCNFMKIDVEGMELDVLKGARETILNHRPILYVENDRQEKSPALIGYIDSLGYKMYWHFPQLFNRDNFYQNSTNIFENIVSANLLCVHSTINAEICGFRPVKGPDDNPFSLERSSTVIS